MASNFFNLSLIWKIRLVNLEPDSRLECFFLVEGFPYQYEKLTYFLFLLLFLLLVTPVNGACNCVASWDICLSVTSRQADEAKIGLSNVLVLS